MTTTSDARHSSQTRVYDPETSVVFLKTNERFGGLSNMAPGFPLRVNGVRIRTSEALYQACRFPHMPDVQRKIIDEHSPMTAKMRSKPFRKDSRPDWDVVRVKIMRWCLRVKLAQNWREFGRLLLATGDNPIVEQSRKDDFWGAKVAENGTLVGMNVLGRLLMELREQLKGDEAESLRFIAPLAIPEFLLFGQPIEAVQASPNAHNPGWAARQSPGPVTPPPSDPQPSLFEQPMIFEVSTSERRESRAPTQAAAEPSRYPSYRPARVHWLGEIPAHWSEKRGKYFFREIDERSQTGEEELLSVSHTTGVTPRSQKNVTMFKAESYVGHKVARPNDIVINTMWAWMSALGVSKDIGIVSPAYGVYRPLNDADFLPAYVDYLLRTPMLRWEYICRSTGIRASRLRLYPDKFLDIALPCPPREEQERMVAFLRAKDLQVRRLIRNKRRLIGLLNEQKQAIINRAVTRGLNSDAPMKPTGIDWMPEVPAHWEVRKVKQVASFNPSRTESSSDFGDEDEVVFLPMENVSASGEIDCSSRGRVSDLRSGYTYFKRHDVVVAKITPCFENGKGAYLGDLETDIGFGTTEFVVLRASPEINPRFLYQVTMLRAFRRNGEMAMTGAAGQQRVPLSFMREFMFGLPDLSEQEAILAFVDCETRKIDQTIEKAKSEMALVMEYRERLIADVITGKLDVRYIEIAAPEDDPTSDEDGTLDEELEADDAEVMEGADADE